MSMNQTLKLTEDETINLLIQHLEKKQWNIDSCCLGQQRGCDIVALKDESKLLIEVKGARAGDNSPTKKRKHFDSGQIKTHFGKAIVKALDDMLLNPDSGIAIAHPDDIDIRKSIGKLTPLLKTLGIRHFWVSSKGHVIED